MQLIDLKTFVRSILTEPQIKAFGYDLRTREAWEVLADRCREDAAAAAEVAAEQATKAWEIATSESAQRIYRGILLTIVLMLTVTILGLKAAAQHCWERQGRAIAQWALDQLRNWGRVALGQLIAILTAAQRSLTQRFRIPQARAWIKITVKPNA
jgi:hypothetical protein